MSKNVYIGSKKIDGSPCEHWAVKVGYTWYEISGAGKGKGKKNIVLVSYGGSFSERGAEIVGTSVGKTRRDDDDIKKFNDRWLRKHPKYNALWGNCQIYARELVTFCCGPIVAWPRKLMIQSSAPTGSARINTYCIKDENKVKLGLGHMTLEGSVGPLSGRLGGPRVAFQASKDYDEKGIFLDAELYRAEANLSVVRAAVAPNVSTGIGCRDGNFEASLLGTGFGFGDDGFKIKTPVFEASVCTIQ